MLVQVDWHSIPYNKEATRWLRVWLDSELKLSQNHRIRLAKPKQAEARVRSLVDKLRMTLPNVRRIKVAAVQAVALYGAELWWDRQKDPREDMQLLVNRQARAISGALPPTTLGPLTKQSGLRSEEPLFNNRTRRFGLRLLSTPSRGPDGKTVINPVSEMIRQSPLPVSRPQFPDNDPRWKLPGYNHKKELAKLWKGLNTFADRLWDAATSSLREDIPSGFQDLLPPGRGRLRSPILLEAAAMLWTQSSLKARVIVDDTDSAKAIAEAWTTDKGFAVFTDGSKCEEGWTGCAAVWKSTDSDSWQGRKVFRVPSSLSEKAPAGWAGSIGFQPVGLWRASPVKARRRRALPGVALTTV
jgi:hypothetical protein